MTRSWKGHMSHIPLSQEEKWNVFHFFQTKLGLGKESSGERIGLTSVGFPLPLSMEGMELFRQSFQLSDFSWRKESPIQTLHLWCWGQLSKHTKKVRCAFSKHCPTCSHNQRSEVTGTNCWQLLPSLSCYQPSRMMRFSRKPPGSPSPPPLSCFTYSFQKRHRIRKTLNMQLYCNILDI